MAKRQYALFTLNNAYRRFANICIIMHIGVLAKRLYALKNNKMHIGALGKRLYALKNNKKHIAVLQNAYMRFNYY